MLLMVYTFLQRSKLTASTPITPELFMQWKNKKMKEREAGLAALRAERAKNDRMRCLPYAIVNFYLSS